MQMIIASRLVDGRVVFMDAESGWQDSIADGVLLDDEAESERLLAEAEQAVEANLIVDPYVIEVTVEDGARRPVEVREAIRAFGPSVRTDRLNGSA
ncbi:MAG TPA: DUF2849 domain-containing protein [Gammaproteobacteria bacterium]